VSAVLRTVRPLEGYESRTVAGYLLERCRAIPAPKRPQGALRKALEAMEPGESLVHTAKPKRSVARVKKANPGRAYSIRKIGEGKYRVWRTT